MWMDGVYVWKQIVADIYEPQGLAFVEASATFLTNELLPLVDKTVMDTKVKSYAGLLYIPCIIVYQD